MCVSFNFMAVHGFYLLRFWLVICSLFVTFGMNKLLTFLDESTISVAFNFIFVV